MAESPRRRGKDRQVNRQAPHVTSSSATPAKGGNQPWEPTPGPRGSDSSPGPGSRPSLTRLLLLLLLLAAAVSGQRLPACQGPSNNQQAVCNCTTGGLQTTADCSRRSPGLTRVPHGLPADTSVLHLAFNSIARIYKNDLIKLENVRTIFLQHNVILSIEDGAFDTLYNLRILVLSDNRLTSVPDTWFQHLPSLQSLDLTNNQIWKIHRRAFLTLPASISSEVVIKLKDNRLWCDCTARALRDWRRSLNATLTPVKFDGYQCANGDGQELDGLPDVGFNCSGPVPAIFEANPKCATCQNNQTQHRCGLHLAVCGLQDPVCQSEVRVTDGKLNIRKTCGAYTNCLLRARNNHRLCNLSHSAEVSAGALDCFFCCSGSRCNLDDMGGRTRSFKLYVGVKLAEDYESYLSNSQDIRTVTKSQKFVLELYDLFQGVPGGYDVSFLSFRDDNGLVYVTCLVQISVLNTYTVNRVGAMLTNVLNNSARNGFLDEEKAILLYVGTELSSVSPVQWCPKDVMQTSQGLITWPRSKAGVTVSVSCPRSTSTGLLPGHRQCNWDGTWRDPDLTGCQGSDVTDRLMKLNNTDIRPDTVDTVLTQLEQLTSAGASLTATDVTLAVDMVNRSLTQGGSLQSGGLSLTSSLNVLSNVLDADNGVLVRADRDSRAAVRVLAMTDTIGAEASLGQEKKLLLTSPNVAVGALVVDPASFEGVTLTAQTTSSDLRFEHGDVKIQPLSSNPARNITSLVLPPSLLTETSGSRIAMKALVSDKLFKVIQQSQTRAVSDSQKNATQVNSHVLDATLVGQQVSNLVDPVTSTFVHLSENASNPDCVFWDVRTTQWSSEGCRLDTDLSTATSSTCRCDHLTNFALLMDVYGEGASLSETDRRILSIISYIGCGVSLLALILTLITYILFKKLRRDNPSKILVNLCLALALSNLVFVAGMQPYALDNAVGCKVVAVLLHFSLLAALSWMAVEAFYMYLALVLVFKTYFTNFILKCSLVGWGVPLLTVAITLGVNQTDNYGPLSSGVCWLQGLAFYVAFVAPVGLILVVNFVAFGLVLRQILGLSQRKLNRSDSFTTAQQLRGAVGVAILLGLTWVFALFAIDRASVVFYYLFAIFNSLQGLWIFVFYCLLKKEARNAWRRALPCCRSLDDKFTLSNARAGYSATNTRTERSKSSTENGGTTKTAFTSSTMDSEGSEQRELGSANKGDQNKKPVSAVALIQSGQVHIKLTEDDHAKGDGQPPSSSSKQADGTPVVNSAEADDHVTRLVVSRGTYVPQGSQSEARQTPATSGVDPEASPRPLHFKVGYTISTVSQDMSQAEETTSASANGASTSVAELIKKMNTTRL